MKIIGHSRLNKPEKHKYISIIEYSIKHAEDEFSANEACSETGLSLQEFRFIRRSIFVLDDYQAGQFFDNNKKLKWIIRPEAYFSYFQYIEFCHSNEHATRAYWLSVLAVIISIIGVGLSLK